MWTVLTRTAAWATLAIGLVAAPTQAQTAPDPQAIAARCIQQVHQASDEAGTRNASISTRTTDAISGADDAGAPDAEILRIANRGQESVDANTRASIHRVRSLVERCLVVLRRLDADPALADAVRAAGGRGVDRIQASAAQAREAIRRATAGAIDG